MRVIKSRVAIAAPQQSVSTDLLEGFIGSVEERKKASKRAKASSPGARRKQYIAEVERRIAEQDWAGTKPGLLVALYWSCHVKVYGVVPAELDSASTWTTAMKAAGNLVNFQFNGNVQTAIAFMRWLWTREQGREQWRRKNQFSGSRITWVRQFCRYESVSDWRADKVRHQG